MKKENVTIPFESEQLAALEFSLKKKNTSVQAQLEELLTNYGDIFEVWFDGACAEGPNGKKQEYDWAAYFALIRRLQPDAVISIEGPDVRWVGNEAGRGSVSTRCVWGAEPAGKGSAANSSAAG